MKVRLKKRPELKASSGRFNVHGLNEVIVGFADDMDSCYINELDVFIEALDEWKDMAQAFKDGDLITDNFNTIFFEPRDEEERQRGYSL